MIANKCFRRYFDFAQYDKTGIFTQPVSVTNSLKTVILSDAIELYRRMKTLTTLRKKTLFLNNAI